MAEVSSEDTLSQTKKGIQNNVVATLKDVDVLDCPICCEPLCAPVYQCDQGHLACGSCCKKIRKKCPSCTMLIGVIRCMAIERVVQSAKVNRVKEHEDEKVATLEDVDVLDCPICREHLAPPVYQCDQGHLACDSCCKKKRYSCPSCTKPIGFMRCRAMERVVESAKVPCGNAEHGCQEKLHYSEKLKHEENECKYAVMSCLRCDFAGVSQSVYIHFAEQHRVVTKQISFNSVSLLDLGKNEAHIILQERDEKIIFVINRVPDPLGSFLNVVCVAHASSGMKFSYDLTVKSLHGERTVKITSPMEITRNGKIWSTRMEVTGVTPKCIGRSPKENGLLFIPDSEVGCSCERGLKLELIIQKVS